MFADFDFNVIERSWRYLIFTGLYFSVQLTALAALGGVFFGSTLAFCRLSKYRWLAVISRIYVDVMRSIPMVLVIFWFYFLFPYINAWIFNSPFPVGVGALKSCVMTFVMVEACYYCEIVRAGINSVSRGQFLAGAAMGMKKYQVMRFIIMPQAVRRMIPVLLTQTIVLFQDVSLVYVLSITDFVGAASKIAMRDGRTTEMYLFVAVVYFIICFSLSKYVTRLKLRLAIQ